MDIFGLGEHLTDLGKQGLNALKGNGAARIDERAVIHPDAKLGKESLTLAILTDTEHLGIVGVEDGGVTGTLDLGHEIDAAGGGVVVQIGDLLRRVGLGGIVQQRERLGGQGVALIVGKMQVQIIDLIKEANIHELQHLPEGVPAAGEVAHQRAVGLVGAILDAHAGQGDTLLSLFDHLQQGGKGVTKSLGRGGVHGRRCLRVDHVGIRSKYSVKAKSDAALRIGCQGATDAGKIVGKGCLIRGKCGTVSANGRLAGGKLLTKGLTAFGGR